MTWILKQIAPLAALAAMAMVCCNISIAQSVRKPPLSTCMSESFQESLCPLEIAEIERQYPSFSVPDDMVENLASAYLNMAHVSEERSDRESWQRKELDLFKAVLRRASTSDEWYLVSRIANNSQDREASLQKAIALNSGNVRARRELVLLDVELHRWNQALAAWNNFRSLPSFRWDIEAPLAIRLVNGLSGTKETDQGIQVLTDVVSGTRGMDSVARCYMFGRLGAAGIALDPNLGDQVKRDRLVCTIVEHRNKGVAALLKGDRPQAIKEFETQIKDNPEYAEPYFLLERTLRSSGQLDRALGVLRELFRAQIGLSEKCAGINDVPINSYASMDPQFVREVRQQCAKK